MRSDEVPSLPSRRTRVWWAVLLPFWIAAVAWTWARLDEGWIPHDEGTLAQAAERVLAGEIPHADFDSVYTGGLDWLNAGAFRAFGVDLLSIRIVGFLVFAAWVPVFFWILTRFLAPLAALPFAALGAAWSLQAYPAAMPSWYVLFLATFGAAALLRHHASGRRGWLVAAGACGGLAVLAKVTGTHFVAAGLLALAWREPSLTGPEAGAHPAAGSAPRPGRLYPIAVTGALVAFVAALAAQIAPLAGRPGLAARIEQFVLPGAIVAALVGHRAWTRSRAPDAVRFRAMTGLVAPFLAGFLAPVVAYATFYAGQGALEALVEGVLVRPARRLTLATTALEPAALWTAAGALPLVLLPLLPPLRAGRGAFAALAVAGVLLATVVVLSVRSDDVFQWIEAGHHHLVPAACVAAAPRLATARGGERADGAMILLAAAALGSLVQFPFSAHVYFYYCAPLLVLAVAALAGLDGAPLRERPGIVLVAAFELAAMLVVPFTTVGRSYAGTTSLENPRARLFVPAADAAEYDRVVALLRAHARGDWMWAGPDAPEVAFLAGLRNPTRTIFDCFDADFEAGARARADRLLGELEARSVTAVAVNGRPGFSGPPEREVLERLARRYPNLEVAGRFAVAWRD
jgi:hypothetical protein